MSERHPDFKVIKPPAEQPFIVYGSQPTVFLAGSIDNGAAADWQAQITDELQDLSVTLFNPRRDDWDPTWEQDIADPRFKGQVEWEMDHLNRAGLRVYYFAPGSRSPITLLELGLHAERGRQNIVCCPYGFWRRGNVQVICEHFDIPFHETYEDLVSDLRYRISTNW